MKLSPMNDRVLVRAEEQQSKTASGIFLPDSSQDAPQWGVIVNVGPGAVAEGRRIEPTVKAGDRVSIVYLYPKQTNELIPQDIPIHKY